jgi:soluble lytic murein transglycosylase-like protein|tara:strand:- start:795 stop:1292 length:498 start_codon:yes stop_codon:yes gene_type:complete
MDVRDRYDSLFQYYAALEGVDWQLLKAQAIAESGLNPDAESPVGATGLSQFMRRTWEEWGDGTPGIQDPPPGDMVLLDPRDPEDAIRAQAAYMGWLLKCFGGAITPALASYNWGIGRVRREIEFDAGGPAWLDGPSPPWLERAPSETRGYVAKILAFRSDMKAIY